MDVELKREKRHRRHKRIRAKIFGTANVPRLCVFRSNCHIYAQLIDDEKGYTLVTANDLELKTKSAKRKTSPSQIFSKNLRGQAAKNLKLKEKTGKIALSFKVGQLIAEKALKKKIKKVVFDRRGYKYHGKVKALAEGAREGGLKF